MLLDIGDGAAEGVAADDDVGEMAREKTAAERVEKRAKSGRVELK